MHSNPTDSGTATGRKVRTVFWALKRKPQLTAQSNNFQWHLELYQLHSDPAGFLRKFPSSLSALPFGWVFEPCHWHRAAFQAPHAAPLQRKGSEAATASSSTAHARKLHLHPQRSCHWCSTRCFLHTNTHCTETTDGGLLQHCHCNRVSGVLWQKSQCKSCLQLTFDF